MSRIINTEELMRNAPFELSKADKEVFTTTEEAFAPHTWEDIQEIIACGDTSQLKRSSTDLRNYIFFARDIQNTFGSIRCHYRHAVPFADQSDYRILRNDWPYAMSPCMVHLVVWLKTPIPVDAEGDPTTESRRLIADFIERTFAIHMSQREPAGDNIQWFKNRIKWQNVRALEHIHVIRRHVDDELVTKLTGQVPDGIVSKSYSASVDSN
ncbi:hypothetical protein BDV38DRAFT_276224 [Aspergillus pseudotamarii]|uniref:Uncharacterized protein n=1 Tax=Aspergillus pseudotamarii TaxID=132259 RepID=A0A5N6S8Z2_ASPPS|nr:uncharacterized protein BDV38DRAFT_276224 [Aspergillus pseudotamarii]KAE8131112.1 hypothetical protein BDV38DRAFT_276224 [Aspergillus pseudotamarii]